MEAQYFPPHASEIRVRHVNGLAYALWLPMSVQVNGFTLNLRTWEVEPMRAQCPQNLNLRFFRTFWYSPLSTDDFVVIVNNRLIVGQ